MSAVETELGPSASGGTRRSPVADRWQAPLLILAVALLLGGLYTALATAPKPDLDALLRSAERLIERERYERALEVLNGRIRPYVHLEGFGEARAARFHLLRGRAIHLGQKALGIDRRDNYRAVVAELMEAERRGAALEPRDIAFLAEAQIALGMEASALERAATLPDSESARRASIVRQVVERRLDRHEHSELDISETLSILSDFLGSPTGVDDADRIWGLARQAELLIRSGRAAEAVERLLRGLPRLADRDPAMLAELYLMLGRAYLEDGAVESAARQLERAVAALAEGDPLRGEALVLLGRIDELHGDLSAASARYTAVVDQYEAEPAHLPALLGLAEVEADLGHDDAALAAYARLLEERALGRVHRDVRDELIGSSLVRRARQRLSASQPQIALRYAQLAEDLFGLEQAPTEVLHVMADAHAALGQSLTDQAPADDVTLRARARQHFMSAGAYARLRAGRLLLDDAQGYADAVWASADAYDRAGELSEAIAAYTEYVNDFPRDPRQPEARYRLGRAYMASGDYASAMEQFRSLIEDANDRLEGKGVGPFADLSYVPLAQCYLLDTDPDNDVEAEELLARVADGAVGGPATAHYADALFELGRYLYHRGRYVDAVARLRELLERHRDDPRRGEVLFLLGDAYRLDAEQIGRSLAEALPDNERRAREAARRDRLTLALDAFEQARQVFDSRPLPSLSDLERLYRRNATFYLGACAFDLGQFDQAIAYYEQARERHLDDPATLVALTQIVSAYLALGDLDRARAANARARRFYESLPESVWTDPSLPISRADWERWLDATGELSPIASAESNP